MASTVLVDREEPAVVTHRASRLPSRWRLPLFFGLVMIIRIAGLGVLEDYMGRELGMITRSVSPDETGFPIGKLAYRYALLYYVWRAKYDWIDAGCLTLMANFPYAYLITSYFNVSLSTAAANTAIEVVAVALPLALLRGSSKYHHPDSTVPNRFLLESSQVQASTTALAIGVYTIFVVVAQKLGWLNTLVLTYFGNETITLDGKVVYETIVSFERATEALFPLAGKILFMGYAARTFLLLPSIGLSGTDTPVEIFDPATADLPATLKHNFWYFSKRTRTLLKQAAVAVLYPLASSVPTLWGIRGAELTGAVQYSAFWAAATLVTTAWLAWIGNDIRYPHPGNELSIN